MDIRVNGDRLWSSLMEMAELGALPGGGSCRLALTDADVDARDLFVKWCREAGCDIAIDQAGNIFATRPGRNADAPAIATGSHLDTQPHGGRFDGVLGVLAGLEVVRTLNDAGIETEKPVAAVNWTNEEGVRFPRGILGSAAYIGAIDVDSLHALQSTDGHVLGDELRRSGYLGDLAPGAFPMERFYEVHIEQGPVLEREGLPVGIVTAGQGIRWFEVVVDGEDRHAGTTPMDVRRDSLVVAADMIRDLHSLGNDHRPDARVTVGRLYVEPNAVSTVPGRTRFVIDLRHPDSGTLDRLEREIDALCRRAAAAGGCGVTVNRTMSLAPIAFDAECIATLEQAASRLGLPNRPMISGAGHDACNIATVLPAAMIFAPSRDGISHNEAEYTEPEHCAAVCDVLLQAMMADAGAVR